MRNNMKLMPRQFVVLITFTLIVLTHLAELKGRQSESRPELSKVRFGFASSLVADVNADDALAATKIWADTLGVEAGLWSGAEAEILHDYNGLAEKLIRDELDVIALPSCDYITLEQDLEAKPAITYVLGNDLEVEYVFLIPENATATTIGDLKGRRIAVLSKGGVNSLATMWLDVHLMENGFGPTESFFDEVRAVQKPSQAMLPVFFNQMDAAVVTRYAYETMVELNPQLGRKLKILCSSKPFVTVAVCLRNNLDEKVKKRYVDYVVKIHENPRALQTFTIFKVTQLVRWEPSFLDNVRELMEKYNQLSRAIESLDNRNPSKGLRK